MDQQKVVVHYEPGKPKSKWSIEDRLLNFSENLEHHYKNKPYSVIGMKGNVDSRNNLYKTYGLIFGSYKIMEGGLFAFIDQVDKIINSLLEAESNHNPEGKCICKKECIVDWRMFPKVEIDQDFTPQPNIKLVFRCSVYHKEV